MLHGNKKGNNKNTAIAYCCSSIIASGNKSDADIAEFQVDRAVMPDDQRRRVSG
jgi:hypothetical protein